MKDFIFSASKGDKSASVKQLAGYWLYADSDKVVETSMSPLPLLSIMEKRIGVSPANFAVQPA